MKKLLVLVASLLLAGPALADSFKGTINQCPSTGFDGTDPDCVELTPGARAYDTTNGRVMQWTGAAWVVDTANSVVGDPATLNFDDTANAGALEGSITVNCPTLNDCDMDVLVDQAGTPYTITHVDTDDNGNTQFQMGDPLNENLAGSGPNYTMVNEAGNLYIYTSAPYIYFNDRTEATPDAGADATMSVNCVTQDDCDIMFESNVANAVSTEVFRFDTTDAGVVTAELRSVTPAYTFNVSDEAGGEDATIEARIDVDCTDTDDCDMALAIETGAVLVDAIQLIGPGGGAWYTRIGGPDYGNYVQINGTGVMSFVGAAIPQEVKYFSGHELLTDGAQCAAPSSTTLNSGPIVPAVVCTDNDAATIYWDMVMPDNWDAGTVTIKVAMTNDNAAPADDLHAHVAALCRADDELIDNTWGTEVALNIDFDVPAYAQWDEITKESAAVTPNAGAGATRAAGDHCYFRYQVDAAGTDTTQMADVYIMGFTVGYSISDNDGVD